MPRLSKRSLIFPSYIFYQIFEAYCMPRPSFLLELITLIINYLIRSTYYESPHYAVFTSLLSLASLVGRNVFLYTLFSDIISLCSSLNLRDYILQNYR
jgi:hypothetical protein